MVKAGKTERGEVPGWDTNVTIRSHMWNWAESHRVAKKVWLWSQQTEALSPDSYVLKLLGLGQVLPSHWALLFHQYNKPSSTSLPLPQGCREIKCNTGDKNCKNKTLGSNDGVVLYLKFWMLGKKQHHTIPLSNCIKVTPFLNVLFFLCRWKFARKFCLAGYVSFLTRKISWYFSWICLIFSYCHLYSEWCILNEKKTFYTVLSGGQFCLVCARRILSTLFWSKPQVSYLQNLWICYLILSLMPAYLLALHPIAKIVLKLLGAWKPLADCLLGNGAWPLPGNHPTLSLFGPSLFLVSQPIFEFWLIQPSSP